MRHAGEQDLVIPVMESQSTEEQYEGATVIEPKKGRDYHEWRLGGDWRLEGHWRLGGD